VYYRDFAGDLWTSGSKKGADFIWGAKGTPFSATGTKWNSGEPSAKGNCVFVQLRNTTENTSLVVEDCAEKKRFICEVRNILNL